MSNVTKKEGVILDNWSLCPRCNSNRAQKISKWVMPLSFFSSAGCFIWLGLLFPPLWIMVPVLFVLAIIMLVGKDMWLCQDCKHKWVVKKVKKEDA